MSGTRFKQQQKGDAGAERRLFLSLPTASLLSKKKKAWQACVTVDPWVILRSKDMSTSASPNQRRWKPLLAGDEAKAAMDAVNEIAAALAIHLKDEQQRPNPDVFLGTGVAGIALFFAYLQAIRGGRGDGSIAAECLGMATEAMATQPMRPSFFAGFTGISWAAQHIANLQANSSEDLGDEIDLALQAYLGHSPWRDHYDLVSGLVGMGIYCLERGNSPTAIRCLELIATRLDELAEHSGSEVRWFTGPHLLSPARREMSKEGYYDLGVAHGVAGIIPLLAKLYRSGIERKRVSGLLEGAVNWLLRQRLDSGANSSFGACVVSGYPVTGCRLAWCYGDAGIAVALLLAAHCTGNEKWENEALAIARKAAMRDRESCGVVDAFFCHGACGLAHIFNRFYQATGEQIFAEAARSWIQETLRFREPGRGPAGFTQAPMGNQEEKRPQIEFEIVNGIAGVGLNLLAAASDLDPNWDRMFMLDVAPAIDRH